MSDAEGVGLTKLNDLEQLAALLLETAQKLAGGLERQKNLKEIEEYSVRIAALSMKAN